MAQQEEGWPLGLQPLNVRVGLPLPRNNGGDNLGSVSFNTLLTGSPTSSTDSSSDLDTESTGSFFHDKSITLGSLIGVTSIFELSKRSIRGKKAESVAAKYKKSSNKSRTWLFSLCSRDTTDAENVNNNHPPSLGHFLAVERRAATNVGRRNHSPNIYGPDDQIAMAQPSMEPNSLFVDGCIAPPRSSPWHDSAAERGNIGCGSEHEHGIGYGIPVLFSCMCGQSSH